MITLPVILGWLGTKSGLLPLLLEVMAQPILLGICIGWLAKQNSLPDGMRRLFMPSMTPVSDSFDFAFAQIEQETFLILKFSDGRSVYGYFGSNSFANNHGEGGGVFLEALFTIESDGQWLPVEPTRSAWISLSGLTSIEMIPDEGVANGQDHL